MGRALFLLLVVVCCALVAGVSGYEDEWRWEKEEGRGEEGGAGRPEGVDWFLLQDSKQVVKTDAGNMRVVRGFGGKFLRSPLHIGFITMEPRSLFIPQYLDSSLILFIREGFDHLTLSTAFNVSIAELKKLLTRQQAGPIISLSDSQTPSMWAGFLELEHHQKLAHLKRVVHLKEKFIEEPKWSFRKLLISVFGKATKKREDKKSEGPGSYNIYDIKPDFKNNYGYSIALDESDYSPLGQSDASIYLVNLSAIASRSGPSEFFGFTTSARRNRPQFLVGANSLLRTMRGPEFANAFGVSEERLNEILDAQRESVILPSASITPPDEIMEETMEVEMKKTEMVPNMIRSFGNDMILGFD
ncbi:unnamed protein product [Fraxinus pennsylvanica]|uniref:Uncharacterized protein n=1 Tax=Fraxinus pennsylvanica TaxID=56036 RepID=A0AAD1Z580_9LAMI|nr:unnamed protein product [Fraxinus pennsylvanica]